MPLHFEGRVLITIGLEPTRRYDTELFAIGGVLSE